MNKRLISLLLAAAITATFLPASFAENENSDTNAMAVDEGGLFKILDGAIVSEYEIFEQSIDVTDLEENVENTDMNEAPFELMATNGNYYSEWGIYFDVETGTITDCDWTSKELYLPNSIDNVVVSKIADYAFSNCINLQNIKLSEGLTAIGYYAFSGCTSLKSITIPKNVNSSSPSYYSGHWFNNCTSLTTVTFEDGTTVIPQSCLSDAPALVTVNMTDTVKTIYDSAFSNCTNLQNIQLSEGLTAIGYTAFSGCTSLKSITIPKNVNSSSPSYYSGHWFNNCTSLTTVTFEDGTTVIPQSCLSGIKSFANIYIPDTIQTFGKYILNDSPNVTVCCSEYSEAIIYAIDNDINFSITKEITSYPHLKFSNTDYYSKTNEMTGYVPFEVDYEVKDDVRISDKKLTIRIPKNSELVQSTVRIDNVISTNYSYDNNLLTIPLEVNSGAITFCVKPTEYTKLLSYAKMDFSENGEKKSEIIGVVNASIPDISIKADTLTGSEKVTVEGIAPPSSEVELYVGDDLITKTNSVKSGNYKTEVTIPSPQNYDKYTITAKTKSKGNDVSADATIMYQEGAPSLKALNMYYGDHNGIHKYELSNQTVKPTIVYNPAYGFKFQAEFDNAENLDKVYIVSTRNNQKKYMNAEWDEATKSYIAEGRFEGTNSSYVPGEITVEFTKKRPDVPVSDTIDAEYLVSHMNEAVKDFTTEVKKNTDTEYESTISVSSELSDLIGDEINMVVTKLDKEYNDIPISDLMKTADNYYSYFIDKDSKKYVLNLDMTDPETLNMVVHDIASNKQISYALDFLDNSTVGNPSTALKISEVLGQIGYVTGAISDIYDIENADDDLRDKIYAANMTDEERAEALKKADELKRDRQLFLLTTMAISVATMGIGGPPALVFGLLFGAVTTSSSFFWDMRMANILGGGTGYSCKWSIDPSGYVYEAVTSNRLEGVTATAYWIAPDYIDDDGNGDTSKSELWDASEYAQANPLLTDINGMYAWDVPEGLWQVKYEKDGYETQTSEWLPVPPPQTEVNIGLVSKDAPIVESAELTSHALTVTFDKYMKPETVTDVNIGSHNFTMRYNKNEAAPDGTVYAKTFIFELTDDVADSANVAVTINNAESYAGVNMTAYSENIVCSNNTKASEPVVKIENQQEDKDNKKVSADFTNLTDKMQAFEAICAVYDGSGALIEVISKPIIGLDANATENKNFIFDKEWSSYKIFAWDSINSMHPISE